jgi:hypothetical protein
MDLTEDEKIEEFREAIRRIKKIALEDTYDNQSTTTLEDIQNKLKKIYFILKPVVYENISIETIGMNELKELFYDIFDNSVRSFTFQNQLEYYLKRDLIEYPFSIDEKSIDAQTIYSNTIIDNNNLLSQ